MQRKSMTEP